MGRGDLLTSSMPCGVLKLREKGTEHSEAPGNGMEVSGPKVSSVLRDAI